MIGGTGRSRRGGRPPSVGQILTVVEYNVNINYVPLDG
jgi:hypothetical protein